MLDIKLVAYGNEKRFEIDRDHVKRKSRHKLKNTLKEIFLQKNSSTHISLSKYYIKKATGHDLTIVDLGQSIILERIDAKKITWNSDSLKWSINDYSIRHKITYFVKILGSKNPRIKKKQSKGLIFNQVSRRELSYILRHFEHKCRKLIEKCNIYNPKYTI